MRIDNNFEYFKYSSIKKISEKGNNELKSKEKNFKGDVYVKTEIEYMKATYSSMVKKNIQINPNRWKELKADSQKLYDEFKTWVEDKIKKQLGITDSEKAEMKKELEDGQWSPEAVSDRIIEFAKSISGGDKSKINLLKDAVKKGFDDVKGILGGKLPEVSEKTYDLVMKKFEAWEKGEDEIQIEKGGVEYINVKEEIIKEDKK
ncbi:MULTISPECIES: hypothetical protein [unclassified Marinitoga]|uniref:hypothetical protein n=1 Tax=unclassified Marinitoga TaxID=2640159 RepID=UPI00065868FD|nr:MULTISPECIES: hypothetical protein [unclassified Marinitoga]KLO23948.1 hypothetical protein X274_05620 [Marinitoga sp. 1155]